MTNLNSIPLPCLLVSKDGIVMQANDEASGWFDETSLENKCWNDLIVYEKQLTVNGLSEK
ncbi:hypothetical protein [Sinobaca sp. H24]|uniref:hypothetical protein n=1 Tax=Sinobaca sp. H24 TaxID=2923376 RepID=UPI00207A0EA9|nr:hypothetical protein [Sinobaca sp. H24]